MRKELVPIIVVALGAMLAFALGKPQDPSSFLKIPGGFSISTFADHLGHPRVIVFDPAGNLLASLTSEGKIVAFRRGKNREMVTLLERLNRPHGIAFRGKKLYVAETDKVSEYEYDPKTLTLSGGKKIADLPGGGNHFTRTLLFTPDGKKLLVSVGSSCNVCRESDWRRAKILEMNPDGSRLETFASGLRNSVFMAIHPATHRIWATEMGRDWLGDNLPPDEINVIEKGKNYGWPDCYGKNVHDTDFDRRPVNPCHPPNAYPSTIDIPAHSAPLGLAFFPAKGWPSGYRYSLLTAYHGSWNRSSPTGYKVVRIKLDASGRILGEEDFITGWLTGDGRVLGRPVGIAIRPDGTIFISDDKAGVIYRLSRKP